MLKEDLLHFLNENLAALPFNGDLTLDWDKKRHAFVLEITFYIENETGQELTDLDGVLSAEKVISFNDYILLYDQTKGLAGYQPDDFLICLPFDGKKGWTRRQGKAFFSYLKEFLTQGQRQLAAFLADDSKETFELEWSAEAYAAKVAQTDNTEQGNLPYPKF